MKLTRSEIEKYKLQDVSVAWERITPEEASTLLEKSAPNRRLNHTSMERYAFDVADDNWYITGETIIINSAGELCDGQHRLHAIVKAGVPMVVLVVRGISRQSMQVIDSGISRTVAHQLQIANPRTWDNKTAGMSAAVVRILRDYAGFTLPSRTVFVDAVNKDPRLRASVEWFCENIKNRGGATKPAWTIACHYLATLSNRRSIAEKFLTALGDRNLGEVNTPLNKTYNYVDGCDARKEDTRLKALRGLLFGLIRYIEDPNMPIVKFNVPKTVELPGATPVDVKKSLL
jgi:hypothetical protein